jgi:hypothetical protein
MQVFGGRIEDRLKVLLHFSGGTKHTSEIPLSVDVQQSIALYRMSVAKEYTGCFATAEAAD